MQDFLYAPTGSMPVEIYEDGGGLVTEYQRKAIQYTLENRRVEIRGSCRSACVLALSVPTVCVTPMAVVKAHYAYEKDTRKVRLDVTNDMLSVLPSKIRETLNNNIAANYTNGATLTYAELRELGIAACATKASHVRSTNHSKENALEQIFKFFGGRRWSSN